VSTKSGQEGGQHEPVGSVAERACRKLERDLGPDLMALLRDPATQDVLVNPDGQVWIERHGSPMEWVAALSASRRQAVIETVAGFHGLQIDLKNPTIDAELPIDGSRFAGELPPVVEAPSFSIRKHASAVFSLEEYVRQGAMSDAQRQYLQQAIAARKSILVIGGTGSGKTTLVNALLKEMVRQDASQRILVVEDTRELQCEAPNRVHLRTSPTVSLTDLVRGTLRRRPDRIIVGEVRGPEALDLLMVLNTGHPGGIATLHANDAASGLTRLSTLVSMHPHAPREIAPLIADAVDLLVFIERTHSTPTPRKVSEILELHGFENGSYVVNAPRFIKGDPS
jgi:type IV secretion system protein TrbB